MDFLKTQPQDCVPNSNDIPSNTWNILFTNGVKPGKIYQSTYIDHIFVHLHEWCTGFVCGYTNEINAYCLSGLPNLDPLDKEKTSFIYLFYFFIRRNRISYIYVTTSTTLLVFRRELKKKL